MPSIATNSTTPSRANISHRPESGENAPYYDRYTSLVQSDDVVGALEDQRRQTIVLLSARTEADGEFRYAPDKWTLKEVIGHLNDTERIMCYRALRISRGDATPIEGYEQDDYVRNSPLSKASMPDLDRRLHRRPPRHRFSVPKSRRTRMDPPRRRQQERSHSPRLGLHHRGTRIASSPNY